MKKSTTKTISEENVESQETKKELTTENGGTTLKKTPSLTSQILELINSNIEQPQQYYRIIIEELNEKTGKLIEELWDQNVTFVVGADDNPFVNNFNFEIVNRSGSMGRWRVTNLAQIVFEEGELFISCKERTDEELQSIPTQKKINLF